MIPVEGLGLAPLAGGGLEELTRTSDYLPQLRVYGSSNDIVKSGDFPMGHFGLYFAKDNVVDLTEQFDCLVIYARPRACVITGDTPVNFYGKSVDGKWEYSKEFEEIKARAMAGGQNNQGYMCGLEYLLWLPDVSKFALFLMGNPTLRRESNKVLGLIGKAATFKIKLIKTAKYTWHGCSCFQCSTPFSNVPSTEDIKVQVEKFLNPEESEVELAEGESRVR